MSDGKKAVKPGEKPADRINWNVVVHDRHRTVCKHGTGPCDVCGTSDRTDARHTTVGGKGLVARLREKK